MEDLCRSGGREVIVVTAGTAEYRRIVEAQARRCKGFGYNHVIYDLGDFGIGELFTLVHGDLQPRYWGHSLPPCTFKTDLVVGAIGSKAAETVCWLDADCIPIKPFVPDGDWDAAVTLRPLGEIGRSGYRSMDFLNSGTVWFRSLQFAQDWQRESHRLNTDQDGLNEVVGPEFSKSQWKAAMGKTISTGAGYRVKILDARQWNCWILPPKSDTRILHFKRKIRGEAVKYLQ